MIFSVNKQAPINRCIEFTIPLPPSANVIWRALRSSRGGSPRVVKSPEYKAWIDLCHILLVSKKIVPKKPVDKYELEILLPQKMRGDIDNRVKPINDLLQRMKIVNNDKDNVSLFVKRSVLVNSGDCLIKVKPYLD
jgi:Holliday junction resolvase RusA-like endonuclease